MTDLEKNHYHVQTELQCCAKGKAIMRLTPTIATKKFCLECIGKARLEAINCTDMVCAFYPHRPRQKGRVSVKAIRKFCLQCTSGDKEYVRNCPTTKCLCYPFRMGKNPAYIGREPKPGHMAAMLLSRRGIAGQKTS